jgi:hypothetical protein
MKKNKYHHHYYHDFVEKLKREKRIKNENKEIFSSSEYRREFENVRVVA